MRVRDGLPPGGSPDVGVHGATLDRAGADQGDLDREVVVGPGLQAGQRADLGPALDLEHSDRVGPAQHVVDRGLLLGHRGEVPLLTQVLGDDPHRVVERPEHAEAQQVELDQPHPLAGVLVPLQDRAVVHAPALDGAHLADGPLGEDHAAGVDAEVTGTAEQLLRQRDDLRGHVGRVLGRDRAPRIDLLGPRILLAGRVAQRLGRIAYGRTWPVGDDVGDLRGVVPAVGLVDPLDDLLAPVGVEVDVDVGLLLACRGEEPLERQVVEDRVDRRDAQGVAERGVGRGAPALAQDLAPPGLLDDVADDQEVAREVLLLDDLELAVDALARLVGVVGVSLADALLGQLTQIAHRGVPLGDAAMRQPGRGGAQVERQLVGDGDRTLDSTRVAMEQAMHFGTGSQVCRTGRRQPAVHLGEAAARADRRHGGSELAGAGLGEVHVVGRDRGQSVHRGELGEGVVGRAVGREAVVDQLDDDIVEAEQRGEPVEGGRRLVEPATGEPLAYVTLAAAGEDQPVVAPPLGELLEVVDGPALLVATKVRVGHGRGEPVIALDPARQHQQVAALGIGGAVLGAAEPEGQLGTEDRLELQRLVLDRLLGEPRRTVEAVVIGQCQPVQAQADRPPRPARRDRSPRRGS